MDQKDLRLECLRLASQQKMHPDNILQNAYNYYKFLLAGAYWEEKEKNRE